MDFNAPEFLMTEELANLLRLSDRTLEQLRKRNEGPPYLRFGRRIVYSRQAVAEWLATQQEPRELRCSTTAKEFEPTPA
jgi:excisionase family DNA binding protein